MHSIYALSQSTSASPPSLIFHKLKQHVCMHFFEKRSILGWRILSFKLFTTNFTIIYAKTCTIHSFYPSRHSACCSTATDSKYKLVYNCPQFCSRKKEPDMGVDPDGSSPIKKGQWDVWLSILMGMALWNYHPGMVRPLFLPAPREARTSMFASLKNERKETAKMQEFLSSYEHRLSILGANHWIASFVTTCAGGEVRASDKVATFHSCSNLRAI